MCAMLTIRREICGYCGACVSVCPEGALELIDAFITVDSGCCIDCGICARICPLGALEVIHEESL
jgi:NAD-dependent dihydropyrimidine dehydrogenase PreA subunit